MTDPLPSAKRSVPTNVGKVQVILEQTLVAQGPLQPVGRKLTAIITPVDAAGNYLEPVFVNDLARHLPATQKQNLDTFLDGFVARSDEILAV